MEVLFFIWRDVLIVARNLFEGFSHPWSDLTFEFSAGENGRPSRLWPPCKSPWTCLSWLKLHEPPFEHCPCAFHSTHSHTLLSTEAFFPFWLLVTDPLSTTSLRTLKFRVLIIWSIWSFTDLPSWTTCLSIYSNGFLIVQSQDSLKLNRSRAILTCTILPRSLLKAYHVLIIELDPIERRNLERRHSANENWTNLRVLVPLHKLWLHGHAHRSCEQFCLPLRNLWYLWAGCSSRHTLFSEVNMLVEKSFQCRCNHRIKHIAVGEIYSSCTRLLCHKIVNWSRCPNFFDP